MKKKIYFVTTFDGYFPDGYTFERFDDEDLAKERTAEIAALYGGEDNVYLYVIPRNEETERIQKEEDMQDWIKQSGKDHDYYLLNA